MSGKALEDEEKNSNNSSETPKMDKLIQTLEGMTTRLTTMPDIPAHIRQMLAQVLELRKNGWGNTAAPAGQQQQQQQQQQQHQQPQQQPVQQLPGGMANDAPSTELTPEEIAFMAEHLGEDFGGDDDDDPDDLPPEVAEAYEQFLADQVRQQNG